VIAAMPQARLAIAGRDPTPAVRALAGRRGIRVLGPVADTAGLYRRAALSIAPIRAAGGTSTKLIEAARHGVAFVATPAAAAGLAFGNASCGWIAGTAEAFAAAVLEALAHPGERMGRAARAAGIAAMENDRRKTVERLAARFRALLADPMGSPR
jgi:glycosyltransferase involved in cell wall biosynthesis